MSARSPEDASALRSADPAADQLVVGTVNAPYRREIDAETLAALLASGEPGGWLVHLATLFTDVRPELVIRFAAGRGIPASQVAAVYERIKDLTGERNLALEDAFSRLARAA
jgi:hypothetical protein